MYGDRFGRGIRPLVARIGRRGGISSIGAGRLDAVPHRNAEAAAVESPAPPDDFDEIARLHRAGDLDRAEAGYRRLLGDSPDHADSLHLLGVLEHQRGRHEVAVGSIARAIVLDPGRADYRNNLGVALRA